MQDSWESMDVSTANILNRTTQAFYAAQAESFSATRQCAWAGWQRVLADTGWEGEDAGDVLRCGEGAGTSVAPAYRILDVACGNVRFKSFLEGALPNATWDYHAVDACEQLVGAPAGVAFMPCDIVAALIEGRALPFASSGSEGAGTAPASGELMGAAFVADGSAGDAREEAPHEDVARKGAGSEGVNADLTVCFGFFHHVPGCEARERLLRALCAATVPGGLVAVSLWRFMDEPGLAKKAHESHEAALKYFAEQGLCLNLDANDYLLGWQQAQGIFRYCHHFADEEVKALAAAVRDVAQLTDCFRADGRTGNLNEYLVFRVR